MLYRQINIGDEGAISIAFSLKLNRSLKYLNLDHNSEIAEQTMQYIDSTMRKRNYTDIQDVNQTMQCIASTMSKRNNTDIKDDDDDDDDEYFHDDDDDEICRLRISKL